MERAICLCASGLDVSLLITSEVIELCVLSQCWSVIIDCSYCVAQINMQTNMQSTTANQTRSSRSGLRAVPQHKVHERM